MASSEISVDLVSPGDPGWDVARQAFNLAADQRPALIAYPENAGDVLAVVDFARAKDLRVAPQRTGHAAQAIESLADTLLLRTDRLSGVELDAAARTARIAGGTLWGAVSDAAAPHGLAPLAGSSRTVGVAGYHLGGGLSLASRKLGLAASAVRAIELVTADGRAVRATADSEPELFWALRGGGGNYGVVTALEIDLFELPEIYAGNLFFPAERAREVLHAWRELTLTAPDELTLSGRILQIPDVPGPPPPLRGRAFVVVDVVFLGGESEGAELLAPLRALDPEIDTLAPAGPDVLGRVHMDPEDPVPALTDHALTGPLPPEAIDAFVDAVGPEAGSTLVSAELRQTGGALSRAAPGGGALDFLPGDHFAFGVAALIGPEAATAAQADFDRLREALAPYDVGSYFNFSERPAPISTFFGEGVIERLRAVKAQWDPDDMFVAGHPVA
ncbi:MAG TPA: FAD-binding oxidoreductase [Thermoleophilaceae bacterium]|nr:FAD-binding oxidoreductase [Thermoleophilaceae bacterium]